MASLRRITPSTALAGITVNSTADDTTTDGQCTLREAIINRRRGGRIRLPTRLVYRHARSGVICRYRERGAKFAECPRNYLPCGEVVNAVNGIALEPNLNFDGFNFWLKKLEFNGDFRAAEDGRGISGLRRVSRSLPALTVRQTVSC